MTARGILRRSSSILIKKRREVEEREAVVLENLDDLIRGEGHGSAKSLAKEIGVSSAFLSDVRYGNRNITNKMADGLANLKEGK